MIWVADIPLALLSLIHKEQKLSHITECLGSDVVYDIGKIDTHNFTIAEADSPIPYSAGRRRELGKGIFLHWELFQSSKSYSFLSTEVSPC